MIKLLALDIDDTLTDETGQVDLESLACIKQVRSRGIQISLISARPPQGVDQIARLLDGKVYRACYLGALIQDNNGHDIERLLIDIDVAKDIARFADQHRFSLTITLDDIEYHSQGQLRDASTERVSTYFAIEALLSGKQPILMGAGGNLPASTIYQYCKDHHNGSICLTRHFDLNGLHAATLITHPLAQKKKAILTICELLSIEPKEVLAIGDSESDLRMFEIAGTSVAVANASLSVRNAATFVAPFPHGEGVKWAIEELL